MKTLKFLFAVAATAAVIAQMQLQAAPDNEEQAKMRAVLRQLMGEPPAPTGKAAPAAPVPPKAAPAPAAVPPPKAAPVPPPAAPVVAPAPKPVPATTVVAVPVAVANPAQQEFESVPPPDNAAALAKAREAMRLKMLETQTTAPAATVSPAVAASGAPSNTPTPVAPVAAVASPVYTSAYTPIEAPDSPLSATKQAKLADLLARYRADAITALEYHTQRAAILAQP